MGGADGLTDGQCDQSSFGGIQNNNKILKKQSDLRLFSLHILSLSVYCGSDTHRVKHLKHEIFQYELLVVFNED